MKTINDLVAKLNSYVAYGEFYIGKGKNDNYLLYARNELVEDSTVFDFAKGQPYWSIYPPLGAMHNQIQEDIMNFVYTTDKEHWFDEPEKKYNIIIGEDEQGKLKTAYKKFSNGTYIGDAAEEDDLKTDRYRFTESEIEDLKATLPENMAKIVELGKVEVKDETSN